MYVEISARSAVLGLGLVIIRCSGTERMKDISVDELIFKPRPLRTVRKVRLSPPRRGVFVSC